TRLASRHNTPSVNASWLDAQSGIQPSRVTGGSSNGRTADSDSASGGSNPSPPAMKKPAESGFFHGLRRGHEEKPEGSTSGRQAARTSERSDGGPEGVSGVAANNPSPPAMKKPAESGFFHGLRSGREEKP